MATMTKCDGRWGALKRVPNLREVAQRAGSGRLVSGRHELRAVGRDARGGRPAPCVTGVRSRDRTKEEQGV